jgi:hypothetical protein
MKLAIMVPTSAFTRGAARLRLTHVLIAVA